MSNLKNIHEHLIRIIGAINCLVANEFIESALVLTYSGIDQMSWLAVLDQESNGNDFKCWTEKYLMPSTKLGCTSDDLWAARNGLVHTAAAESRDFYKSKAKRIYYVCGNVVCTENNSYDTVIINSTSLITAFIEGVVAFAADLEADETRLTVAANKAEILLTFKKTHLTMCSTSLTTFTMESKAELLTRR